VNQVEVGGGSPESASFQVRQARRADAQSIVRLVNQAFAVEHFFKEGERTDLDDINAHLDRGIFLLLSHGTELAGCVYVQIGGARGYIGLLSIDPGRQRSGLGSLLMQHAEDYCARAGCVAVDLRIIHLRRELLGYYGKRGYVERATESAEVVTGAKLPVHFVLLSKDLPESDTFHLL
jgi:GNAT superfamily N-acetyltransferase